MSTVGNEASRILIGCTSIAGCALTMDNLKDFQFSIEYANLLFSNICIY